MTHKQGEISFDIIIDSEKDRDVLEGCYKIGENGWRIFYFTRWWQDEPSDIVDAVWGSGVSGVNVKHPKGQVLNKNVVKEKLSKLFDIDEWIEVKGPDSLALK